MCILRFKRALKSEFFVNFNLFSQKGYETLSFSNGLHLLKEQPEAVFADNTFAKCAVWSGKHVIIFYIKL